MTTTDPAGPEIEGRDAPAIPPPSARAGKPTLVQVISSPHSGSTILGVLLGAAPGVHFGGEMDRIPRPVWHSGQRCSCGVDTSDCPFWSAARERFTRTQDLARFEQDQVRFEPWRSLPRTLAAGRFGSAALQRHARATTAFVRAVGETAGASVVVDTSKLAGRALVYAAARREGLDVRYVHLVRDGRAVIASRKRGWAKSGAKTESAPFAARMARRWVVTNVTFGLLGRRWPRQYLRLRHEDFLSDPVATLSRLERFLGVSLAVPIARLRTDPTFPVVHVPTGNRFRLEGSVHLEPRRSEGRSLPPQQARAFWWTAGPLALVYGYRPGSGTPPRPPAAGPTAQ